MARVVHNFYYIIGVIFLIAMDQMIKAYVTINDNYLKNMKLFMIDLLELSRSNSLFLFILLNILFIYLFWVILKQTKNKKINLIFSLILAGVISNLLDRTLKGHVIDYIHFDKIVFNLADGLIFLGILIFIISSIGNLFFVEIS